jgi:Phosphotransferase enzyme family
VADVSGAARQVALAHGVACEDPVPIGAHSNVLVHLRPAPVVARVMTSTAVLHDDVEGWLERELAVAAFVAVRSDLVVPPTDLMPPGPHRREELWMTFWRFVPHDPSPPVPEPRELGSSLRELHAVLAEFPGELAPLTGVRDGVERLLRELRPSPRFTQRDLDRLARELDELTPTVFDAPLPVQPLHGDASIGNRLRTDAGLVWNDLEDVCTGPVEWDVSGVVASARARGQDARYVEDVLDAYGGPELEDLGPFLDAHALYTTVWQAFDAQRGPI